MPPLEPPLPVPSYAELPSHPTTELPGHQRMLSSDASPITFKRTADGHLGTATEGEWTPCLPEGTRDLQSLKSEVREKLAQVPDGTRNADSE